MIRVVLPAHLRTLYGVQVDPITHADGTISLVPVPLVNRSGREAAR